MKYKHLKNQMVFEQNVTIFRNNRVVTDQISTIIDFKKAILITKVATEIYLYLQKLLRKRPCCSSMKNSRIEILSINDFTISLLEVRLLCTKLKYYLWKFYKTSFSYSLTKISLNLTLKQKAIGKGDGTLLSCNDRCCHVRLTSWNV